MHPLLLNAIDLVEASASSAVYCRRRPSIFDIDQILSKMGKDLQRSSKARESGRLSVEHRLQACGLLWVMDRGQTDIINESIKLDCLSHT